MNPSEQVLTYKTPVLTTVQPLDQNICPYSGKPTHTGSILRTCQVEQAKTSCNVWDKPEVFKTCFIKEKHLAFLERQSKGGNKII